jgi:hypothetical protein
MLLSAIPGIVKLIQSDDKRETTKELISKVANKLNVEPTKEKIMAHLEANPEDSAKLKGIELEAEKLRYSDIANARDMNVNLQQSNSWLAKNTGSVIAMVTMVLCFSLFAGVLFGKVELSEGNVGMLIGGAIGFVTQILSFYFGSSEPNIKDKA